MSVAGLTELLAYASENVVLSPEGRDPVLEGYQRLFDEIEEDDHGDGALNIFTFFTKVPTSHRVIDYVDVKHDHHHFDYGSIIRHFVAAAKAFERRCRIIVVTGENDDLTLPVSPGLRVLRLPLNSAAPMLERVRAMTAYVRSKAFDRNTLFLDTDAFVNAPLESIFDGAFDIGVTVRPTEGFYMPLNEGVILAASAAREAVEAFFLSYLATYDRLLNDPVIIAYYGDIARWRGGQLSLNAVADRLAGERRAGAPRIKEFACEQYNHWVRPDIDFMPQLWDTKSILHLKGDSKYHLDGFFSYHSARLDELVQA